MPVLQCPWEQGSRNRPQPRPSWVVLQSSHGDTEETEEAKRIIEMEKSMEQEAVKCFVVMANRTDLAKFRGARVQAI